MNKYIKTMYLSKVLTKCKQNSIEKKHKQNVNTTQAVRSKILKSIQYQI